MQLPDLFVASPALGHENESRHRSSSRSPTVIFQVLSLDPAVGAHLEGEEDGSGTRGFTAPRPRQELESWTKHSGFCWQRLAEVVAGIKLFGAGRGAFLEDRMYGPGRQQAVRVPARLNREVWIRDRRPDMSGNGGEKPRGQSMKG